MPFVTDTHAFIWHLTDNDNLSIEAKNIFIKADNFDDIIHVPCIIFFELLYLVEKKRIDVNFDAFISLFSSLKNYTIEPICLPIIMKSREIPRELVPDPWDRLIAGIALHLKLPLISKDKKLKEIGVETIW